MRLRVLRLMFPALSITEMHRRANLILLLSGCARRCSKRESEMADDFEIQDFTNATPWEKCVAFNLAPLHSR
jgi:hypothetical protein